MKKFTKGLKKAFTITELVIVIAVIAILAAVLIPTFSNVISSAKESAAMQECRNAYTDISAKLEENNQSSSGLVLTNDGYVFVALNGKLNQIDDLNSLASLVHTSDGKLEVNNALSSDLTTGSPNVTGFATDTFTSYDKANGIEITVTQPKENGTAAAPKSTIHIEVKDNEVVYVYSFKLNDNLVLGYFIMETKDANLTANNGTVVYSRAYGYVIYTAGAEAQGNINFAAGTTAVPKS